MTVTHFRTLVHTSWLREQIFAKAAGAKHPVLRILDASATPDPKVDGYKEFYKQSHVPDACYFNLHGLCPSSPPSFIKYPVPDVNRFQDYAESLGLTNDTHIVTYDRSNTIFALKTWWLFRLFGHTKVSVLDGGFRKWLMDGFEVTVEEPVIERSSFQPTLNPSLVRSFEDMVENIKTKKDQVIDARGAAAFFDDSNVMPPGTIGGHIPGSKNVPYPVLFNEDGTFKSHEELRSVFEQAGVDLAQPVVATCLTAMTACGLAAAAHILGKETVALYNGSFQEWSQRAEPDQIDVD
ncbi:thiosulfate sulfurtransferase-like [Littorina saxatilis]|uniref:Rhodanese domain-containing protein n=1 Tax=Littorina saxatilis TaxID=31220 RepID=A0AAN9BF79_9CAEN